MKELILKILSITILILSAVLIILNSKDLTIHFINLFAYTDYLDKKIILIGILRIILKVLITIYSLIVMLLQVKIIKGKEINTKKKVIILIIPVIGIILQVIALSDYTINMLLMLLLIIEVLELFLVTTKKLHRRLEFIVFISYILIVLASISFSYLFCHKYEIPTTKKGTSTKSVITKNINSQIWQMSTKPEFYYNSYQKKKKKNNYNLIPIPGLSYTDTVSKDNSLLIETCTTMTPQGLVVTDNYIYVSAYCYTHEHNSVIYQIDRKTNKFIKTIVLPDTSHVGGLAYDTQNKVLWIATKKYNTSKKDTTLSTVSCITQDVIDNYDFKTIKQPIRYNETFQTAFTNTSFMTYYNGYLYTGLFSKDENNSSLTAKLKILENGTTLETEPINYYYIPSYVQGMAFLDNKILFSRSFGYKPSEIIVYDYSEDRIDYVNTEPLKVITTYPMLEQVYPYNDELYMIFESTAYAYRYTPGIKIDHIVNLNKKILE